MIANRDQIEGLSERDLQVYAAVRVDGRRQVEVAAEFGISQGRVSQIVRRVNRWRVAMGVAAELERRDSKSVDRWLEQLRIEKLYEETMELFRRSQVPRRKERRGKDRRGGEWSVESIDHQPGNLQCLKLAGRLIELRRQLDEDPPPPDQSLNSPRSHLDEYEAFRMLVDMRNDAIRRGDVPQGEISEFVVRRMMSELVGSACRAEPDGPCDGGLPAEVPPGRRDQQTAQCEGAEVGRAHPTNTERPAAASEGTSRQEAPTEPVIINNISAAAAAEQVAVVGVSDCSDGACATEPEVRHPAAEANNSAIFSREVAGSDSLAENKLIERWGTDGWEADYASQHGCSVVESG